jgi:hypothetical protein
MGKITEKIMEDLSGERSLSEIFEENSEAYSAMSIGDYLGLEIKRAGVTKAKIIRESGVNRRFFFDILSGKKMPSRRYVIRIFLALKLPLADVQWYLKATDYPQLYARDRRDSVIIYCINHKLTVEACNTMLNKIGLESLGFENG